MVDAFMPDVEVHIAFNAGYNTPDASRTWTDVSAYVELAEDIEVTFGRRDELATTDPNQLRLTLDNSDGRFTAMRSSSPYYPNVKIGRPIRVRATPSGGSTVTRFVGFVDEWPTEWDGSDRYATATISATSRLARLSLGTAMLSPIEQEILAAGPTRYWTLADPTGATSASESSGNGGEPLEVLGSGAALTFGNATGPSTDGLTAATFAGGQYLSGLFGASTLATVRFTVLVSAPSAGAVLYGTGRSALNVGLDIADGTPILRVGAAGDIELTGVAMGPAIDDGETHDVALVYSGGNATLYVDGSSVGTLALSPATNERALFGQNLNGAMSHVAIWTTTALTAGDVASIAGAVLNGYAGDRTDERLLRILEWGGVASTEVDAETGEATMTYQQTSGQTIVDALREVESTEGGVLFDGPDGKVHFHSRSHRYTATAAATLNMASQHVGADYEQKLDRSTLRNEVTAENPTTGETSRFVASASRDEYGIAAASVTVVADTVDPLLQMAAWLVNAYSEPQPRVPSLTVDVLAHQGLTPSAQTLLGLGLGDRLDVTNHPSQAANSTESYFIEGYSERIGPQSYSITYNLSPASPHLDVLVLNDATRGQLNAGNVLGL